MALKMSTDPGYLEPPTAYTRYVCIILGARRQVLTLGQTSVLPKCQAVASYAGSAQPGANHKLWRQA
jgi:hypothetical protein